MDASTIGREDARDPVAGRERDFEERPRLLLRGVEVVPLVVGQGEDGVARARPGRYGRGRRSRPHRRRYVRAPDARRSLPCPSSMRARPPRLAISVCATSAARARCRASWRLLWAAGRRSQISQIPRKPSASALTRSAVRPAVKPASASSSSLPRASPPWSIRLRAGGGTGRRTRTSPAPAASHAATSARGTASSSIPAPADVSVHERERRRDRGQRDRISRSCSAGSASDQRRLHGQVRVDQEVEPRLDQARRGEVEVACRKGVLDASTCSPCRGTSARRGRGARHLRGRFLDELRAQDLREEMVVPVPRRPRADALDEEVLVDEVLEHAGAIHPGESLGQLGRQPVDDRSLQQEPPGLLGLRPEAPPARGSRRRRCRRAARRPIPWATPERQGEQPQPCGPALGPVEQRLEEPRGWSSTSSASRNSRVSSAVKARSAARSSTSSPFARKTWTGRSGSWRVEMISRSFGVSARAGAARSRWHSGARNVVEVVDDERHRRPQSATAFRSRSTKPAGVPARGAARRARPVLAGATAGGRRGTAPRRRSRPRRGRRDIHATLLRGRSASQVERRAVFPAPAGAEMRTRRPFAPGVERIEQARRRMAGRGGRGTSRSGVATSLELGARRGGGPAGGRRYGGQGGAPFGSTKNVDAHRGDVKECSSVGVPSFGVRLGHPRPPEHRQ